MAEIVRYYVKHLLTVSVCMKQVQGYLFLVIKNIKQCTFVEKSNKKIVKNLLRFFLIQKRKKQCTLLAKLNKRFLYTFTFFKNKIERRKKTRIKCLGTYRDYFGFLSIIQNNVSQD